MSRTFKLSGIFLISVISLQLFRIVFSYVPFSDNISGWLFSFVFQVGCLGLVPYLLYRAFISKDSLTLVKDFRLNTKIPPISWLLAVVIGLLVFYLNTGISSFWYVTLNSLGFTYVSAPGTIFSSPEVLILEIITSAMLPAIFEEFADRGLLLAVFAEEKNDNKKIILVGVIFGLLHQNVAQLTPTMFGGLVMAYMAVKGASIIPCMIVHFMNNFLITLLQYSGQQQGGFGYFSDGFYALLGWNPLFTLFSYALAAGLIVFILKKYAAINAKNRQALYPQEVQPSHFAPQSVVVRPRTQMSFDDIYGTNGARQPAEPVIHILEPVAVQSKPKKWEYALLYCAVLSMAAVTYFTFLWGLWR
ncbi:MAG: type II CAAX endopeptidase family protein [Clostridia bacterium]